MHTFFKENWICILHSQWVKYLSEHNNNIIQSIMNKLSGRYSLSFSGKLILIFINIFTMHKHAQNRVITFLLLPNTLTIFHYDV